METNETSTEEDTKKLYTALNVPKVDYSQVITILAGNCRTLRTEIVEHYQRLYSEDLVKVLREKLYRGWLKKLLLGLLTPLAEYYARAIHNTLAGFNRDSHTLVDILTTIEPEVLTQINKVFYQLYKMTIEWKIKSTVPSSHLQRMLVLLSLNRRPRTAEVDESLVQKDVLDLYKENEGLFALFFGGNVAVFINVLTQRSKAHVLRVFEEYAHYADIGLRTAILRSFGLGIFGFCKELLQVYDILHDFDNNRAEELHEGITANPAQLVRLAISLAESDRLENIKTVYKEKYQVTLKDSIIADVSGDFRDCLLMIFYGEIGIEM